MAGSCRRTSANTRTTSLIRFTGRKFEMCIRTRSPAGEVALRPVGEVGGDRGDRVGALEREPDDPVKGLVRTDEGDVGSVEGGHHPGPAVPDDLPGEKGAHRVGDRVVRVDDVEPALARHLGQLGREPQRVRRVAEERIGRDLHLVEPDARVEPPQAEGHGVADDVDLVSGVRHPDRQIGSDRTTPAVGRIADDGEAHSGLGCLDGEPGNSVPFRGPRERKLPSRPPFGKLPIPTPRSDKEEAMDPLLKISHRPVTCVPPEETVCGAVEAMVRDRVGAAAVVHPDGTLAGMFSERDVMTRVVALHRDPETTTVGEAMTRDPVTVTQETPLEKALEIMVTHHFRHLPVMDGDKVLAMASVRSVLQYKLEEEKEELESVVSFFTADGIGG